MAVRGALETPPTDGHPSRVTGAVTAVAAVRPVAVSLS